MQVAASALASVSAAVVASLFGVTGTVVGAGLVAVISTTGSAIYSVSMKRTSNQLRRAREQLLTARAADGRSSGAATRPGSTAVLERPDSNGGRLPRRRESAQDQKASGRWRRGWLTIGSREGLKWPALIGAVVLVFAIAIGAVTAFEELTQKPISSITGHKSTSSTTIGSLTGNSSSTATPTPSVSPSGSASRASSTPSATPNTSKTPSPGSSAQSNAPTTPSAAPSASAAPGSAAPSAGTGTRSTTSGSGSGTAR